MIKLSDKPNSGVVYAADAIMPEDIIPELSIHHERLHHNKLSEIIEEIGGKVTGEHVSHTMGNTIDESQFEN